MGFVFSAFFLIGSASGAAAQAERHVIRSLVFVIDGSTNERAIRDFTGLREALDFPSAAALATFLDRARRALVDDRVFRTVEIADEAGAPAEGRVEHRVTVRLVDSPTFAPLPNVSYDSNQGLILGVQWHYDNAFGTMTNWFLDSYVVTREENGSYGIGAWDLHPRIGYIMAGGLAWTLELELQREELRLWDLGSEIAAWDDYSASASIDTKLPLGGQWYYDMQPGFMGQFDTADRMGNGAYPKDYSGPDYRQALGIGGVDWIGNFRSGYDLRLEHFLQTDVTPGGIGLSNEVSATALWYYPRSSLNYYGRVRVQADFGRVPVDLGKWLRGIPDDSMSGVASAFLNQTLGIDLGLPRSILDIQVHPFFDLGTALPSARAWNPRTDIRTGAGADFLFFSDALPDIYIRCTFGLDLGTKNPFAQPEIIIDTTMSY
jgi:hypothetical protein